MNSVGILMICVLITLLFFLLFSFRSHKKKYHETELRLLDKIERKEELIALLRYDMAKLCAFTRHQVAYKSQEEFRSIYEIYGAADYEFPEDVYFVNGYVPVKGVISNEKPYGDYTVYIHYKGNCYHSNKTCGSSFGIAMHLYDAAGSYRPCSSCAAYHLDTTPEWYIDIKRIMDNNPN